MAAAEDEHPEPMEVDSPQDDAPKEPRLLVRGLATTHLNNAEIRQLHKKLQSLLQACKLGEVHRISWEKELDCLQVTFSCHRGKRCVKDIILEIDLKAKLPASRGELNPRGDGFIYTQEQNRDHGEQRSHSVSSPGTGGQHYLHMQTTVEWDLRTGGLSLRDKVLELIQSSNLKYSVSTNDIVKLEGSFEDVALLNQLVNNLYKNVRGEKVPDGAEGSARTPHGTFPEDQNTEAILSEKQAQNQLRLSLFHYEYLRQAYPDVFSIFMNRHKVDIQPEVLLSFTDTFPSGPHHNSAAQEAFTQTVQPMIKDLGRRKVSIADSERAKVVTAFKEIREKKPFFILNELEGAFVITGPADGLKQVETELMNLLKAKSTRKVPLRIKHELTATFTAMEIPKAHWELLENLFQKELDAIRANYQIQIKCQGKSSGGNVQIVIENQNGDTDLSGNALQAFASLYQQAITSCTVVHVDIDHRDRVRELYRKMQPAHSSIKLIRSKGGEVSLIGISQPVESAIRYIKQQLGDKVFVNQRGDLWEARVQSGSEAATKELAAAGSSQEEESCSICLDAFTNKMTTKCKHSFCKDCWDRAMDASPQCPICKTAYGKMEGNQPKGTMTHTIRDRLNLPGFGYQCGTIEISYVFPEGVQSDNHPNPGQRYSGTTRTAYLPDNPEGREVLKMLYQAFKQKLTFTIGESRTTGEKNTVTWNDIHHKTSTHSETFGYPDPDYLRRVKEELRAKGIE
ncbi:E3 ubiquitin-protein ligase DTX3L-like isoform X2 [Lissotriton helveticus]